MLVLINSFKFLRYILSVVVYHLSDGNQCIPNACENGVCVDQFQKYICSCNLGFEGKRCHIGESEVNPVHLKIFVMCLAKMVLVCVFDPCFRSHFHEKLVIVCRSDVTKGF